MMDMPGLNNPNGIGGGGSAMHHHHLHMQGGMQAGLQHMDFSHIQPQLLQQQT
jgi:hypothetical protein